MRTHVLSLTLGFVVAGVVPAFAMIDLNGPWRFEAHPDALGPQFACTVDVLQAGNALSVDGSACQLAFAASGTIDVTTGIFSVSGASDPLACPAFSASGTATPTSDAFAGTFGCTGGVFPATGTFAGSRCGNGVIDPGEDCDDGDVQIGDCCSPTCTFDPASYQCAPGSPCATGHCDGAGTCVPVPLAAGTGCPGDGIDCTADVCDGAGICTHPNQPAGATCFGDFNPCTDGACDGGGTCVLTNNTGPCDDFNDCTIGDVCAGGVCTPGAPAAAGTACEQDYDLCTLEACDAAGTCLATGGCSDCCDDSAGCTPALGSCKGPTLPAAQLEIRKVDGVHDKLAFAVKRGEDTAVAELGDPTTTTAYTFCLYDQTTAGLELAYRASLPAGGTCAGHACWRPTGVRGFAYKDRDLTPDGIDTGKLRAGFAGHASVILKGKGPNLALPTILGDGTGAGLGLPVSAQLRSSGGGCWGATFGTVVRNGPYEFRAKGGE
jgi:cysteine-rich repeat protein